MGPKKRTRRKFSAAFKAETVQLGHASGKNTGEVAGELESKESALRQWVEQAAIDAGRDRRRR